MIKVVRKSIEDVKEIVKGRVNEKGLRKSVRYQKIVNIRMFGASLRKSVKGGKIVKGKMQESIKLPDTRAINDRIRRRVRCKEEGE